MKRFWIAILGAWLAGQVARAVTATVGEPVLNFVLLDHRGEAVELRRAQGRAVILFFTANGCPVARQSVAKLRDLQERHRAQGVDVWLVNSSPGDTRKEIRQEALELGGFFLPVLKDDTQGLARHLGVQRTGEAIAISTRDWKIFYRGAIDDQFAEGAQKPAPTAKPLDRAIEQFLAGEKVTEPQTVARGCVIEFEAAARFRGREVSYVREVVPLLEQKCVSCHSRGNIGSWAMSSHRKVKGMASMIQEVLLTRRMPPWDADAPAGRFANDPSLTVAEAQLLWHWVEQGSPPGEGPDPLESLQVPVAEKWPLGPPDIVLRLPEPQKIPATGVLDYRHIEVAAGNAQAGHVGAVWVNPGNRKVVHHVIARLKDAGEQDHLGQPEMYVGWAPGTTQGWFPKGSGKLLPAQARFDFEMHYTTCGTEETDQTEIGLYLLKEKPDRRYESVPVVNTDFEIRPGDPAARASGMYGFTRGATLHSLTPHMHLRGRWMKFDVLFPDGRRETVCSVPRYDFNWQQTYELAKPIHLPAGSWVVLAGGWDNSARNPFNPDPGKAVHWGEQSWDEMFLGWYNVAWDPEPAPQPSVRQASAQP